MTDLPNTRGIVSPTRMLEHVRLDRFPAPVELSGLVDWFWLVRWGLPMGFTHRQDLVAQPGVNISVGIAPPPGAEPPPGPYPLRAVVNGVTTSLATRVLTGSGWNLAAKTSTGGFGAWVDDVSSLTDSVVPLDEIMPVADLANNIARTVPHAPDAAAARLGATLIAGLADRPAERIETARLVARVAAAVESDLTIRRLDDLADLAAMSPRTLQRLFSSCAGVSPVWVIRRQRLIEAAELVRLGDDVDWSTVATDLGYADQAHLTRDFTQTIGQSPAAYARAQRPSGSG